MTPEQNEQWQAAINPLDYLDFHALDAKALQEFEKRIMPRRGAPRWAIESREYSIRLAWGVQHVWVPEFALRSEVAMVGLKLLYKRPQDRVALYRRILKGFLNRALIPFSDNVEPLWGLRTLCQLHTTELWQWEQQHQIILNALSAHKLKLGLPPDTLGEDLESRYLALAGGCAMVAKLHLFSLPDTWWNPSMDALPHVFAWTHGQRVGERIFGHVTHIDEVIKPTADAFLGALEAECPPPDWLPQI